MSGSSLVMAPAMEHPSMHGMSRSISKPDLVSLSSYRYGGAGQQEGRKDGGFDMPSFDNNFDLDTTFQANAPTRSFPVAQTAEWRRTEQRIELEQPPPPPSRPIHRKTGSLIERRRTWLPGSKSSKDTPSFPSETTSEDVSNSTKSATSGRAKTKTDALTSFAKRSWLPSSSSFSSSSTSTTSTAPPAKDSSSRLVGSRRPELIAESRATLNRWSEPTKNVSRKATSYLSKMTQKQPIIEKRAELDDSSASSATSEGPLTTGIPNIFSPQSVPDDGNATPTTEDSFGELTAQVQDPLWPAFKSIEMEFKSFISRTTSNQVNTVKTILLPFLANTANHPATRKLHPEDLDRRAQVLNTWWSEILDMLDGTAVIGVDRPVLYEALTTIMTRSEWRLTTPHFMSSADRDLRETIRSNSWGKGLAPSSNPDKPTTLVEAAERNVRATFVSSLVKQVIFAVEKISLRYAPLPLVTFTGKTCAYAFFFIPGFAEVLARQWEVSQHQLKRTADELGIAPLTKEQHDDILSSFPSHLHSLGWSTSKAILTRLRREAKTPASMPSLSWSGHWTKRWRGLDTDLFFVFCKYFHILSNDFIHSALTIGEKARSPAFVLVNAQLLSSIDSTLHRQSAEAAANAPPPPTKGPSLMELIPGSDATAMALSLPPAEIDNSPKGVSECKVMVLLRGVLFDSAVANQGARHTFAEAFTRLMAGAVRKTSLYDSHACFTLCDFLEESLTIYDEFVGSEGTNEYIDWSFWLDVFKKMLLSLNTVTEVRVLCFLFSIWDIITRDPERKAALCIDWLLTEDVFNAFYNHWCPLVRGYFHRLLCWRICRCDGNTSDLDMSIYNLVALRLKTTWSHYLYMKQKAEEGGRFPPSSAAMVPTPGKKFRIIRQEAVQPRTESFQNFDSIAKPTGVHVGYGEELAIGGFNSAQNAGNKKKKSLFDKVIALSAGVGNVPVVVPADEPAPRPPARTGSWDDEFVNLRRETAEARTRSPPNTPFGGVSGSDTTGAYSVPEEPLNSFKFILAFTEPSAPPPERVLALPRLPLPAHGAIRVREQAPSLPHNATSLAAPNYAPPPPPLKDVSTRSELGFDEGDEGEPHRVVASSTWPLESGSRGVEAIMIRRDSISSGGDSSHASSFEGAREHPMETCVQPAKPTGAFLRNAVYSGRAMAEWSQVVAECNNFAERRRKEGVKAWKDMEVPTLSVDGFQGMIG